jgi:hypothetical protein
MQFRLSTLFLVIFTVAASLAAFGAWGLWPAAVMLMAAFSINRCKKLEVGIYGAFSAIFIGVICTGLLWPAEARAPAAAKRAQCANNLKQIGIALQNYHAKFGHFPEVCTHEENGKPLFSWREQILPMMGSGKLYESLNQDESWNSPHNAKICGQVSIKEYKCPAADLGDNDCTTNYIAVIGPGTAWRKEGPQKLSDLPDGGSHTVMALETVKSGVHWAEPCDITVEEALKQMKGEQLSISKDEIQNQRETGPGPKISTVHHGCIEVLFADGAVHLLPSLMPLSLWKKLFAGEVKDIDAIEENSYESATDLVDIEIPIQPPPDLKMLIFILSLFVWLFSIVLLFHRAVKSRLKHAAT